LNALYAALLGALQGATEFLPISSSGHLRLAESIPGFEKPGLFFDVALHLGTLVAVVLIYRKQLAALVGGMAKRDRGALRAAALLVVASVPTAVIGLALKDVVEDIAVLWVGTLLLANAAILATTRRATPDADAPDFWKMAFWVAFIVGIAQGIAVLPGISRSGATIATALLLGVRSSSAAAFSFLASIPAILGAAVLTARDIESFSRADVSASIVGAIVAAVVGAVCLTLLLRLLAKARFYHFAWYCVALGLVAIAVGSM